MFLCECKMSVDIRQLLKWSQPPRPVGPLAAVRRGCPSDDDRSSSAGEPQRLLLWYPAPLIPPILAHRPCLPPSTPPTPPTPAPLLLHWAKMPSPGPWVEVWSDELPVLSRLCQPELLGPAPAFPVPAVEPPSTPPAPLLPPAPPLSQLPPLLLAPTAGVAAEPEPAEPAVVPPLPAPPAWECAMWRATSSSLTNSAKMVVFPRTHLKTEPLCEHMLVRNLKNYKLITWNKLAFIQILYITKLLGCSEQNRQSIE